jgi:uncharacterized protein YgiM (DUF1202 family)
MVSKSLLLIGAGVAALTTAVGGIYATQYFLRSQPHLSRQATTTAAQPENCITIATDPQPPLNVRSSPVVAADNVIGKLNNGTQLTVVDVQKGWLRINAPLEGWVYQSLTVHSCALPSQTLAQLTSSDNNSAAVEQTDEGPHLLAIATEQFHAGNLSRAIAVAQSIPPSSSTFKDAQKAIVQWQKDWQIAKTEVAESQQALKQGRSQVVLNKVKDFPDIRYWKEKFTPIVRAAIQQQQQTNSNRSGSPHHQ